MKGNVIIKLPSELVENKIHSRTFNVTESTSIKFPCSLAQNTDNSNLKELFYRFLEIKENSKSSKHSPYNLKLFGFQICNKFIGKTPTA